METLVHVMAIVGTAVGATWVLRTKLSDIEAALNAHISLDAAKLKDLGARVIKLEGRQKRR